jgi:hypothetical protein
MKKGIKIGINDVNGTPIKNGDLIFVEFVNYMGSEKEYVDDNFEGEIVYNPFNCMFMIDKVGSNSESWNDCYVINHRSMRIKIHN